MLKRFLSEEFRVFSGSLPDILAVMEGIKPMARLSCRPEDLDRGIFLLEQQGFHAKRSDRVFGPEYYIYISKDKGTAERAKRADNSFSFNMRQSHSERVKTITEFGRLLGYPECCINHFACNIGTDAMDMEDNFMPSGRISFLQNNVLNGVTNHYFSFHYLCSYGCMESKRRARKLYRAFGRYSGAFISEVDKLLRSPYMLIFDLKNHYANAWDMRKGFWFRGKADDGGISYEESEFFSTSFPEYNNDQLPSGIPELREAVARGDEIRDRKSHIEVFGDGKLLLRYEKSARCWPAVFDFTGL